MPVMSQPNHGMSRGHSSQHQVPGGGPGQQRMPGHGMSPGHPSQHQVPGGPGQQRMPGPPASQQQGQQQTMNMHANSPLNTVPQSPHMVPQSPLSQQHMAPSPMSHPHMSPHPNMSPHPSHTPQHSNTPTHQPSSRDDINLDFLENISPPNAKSQTPLTTTPNDQ